MARRNVKPLSEKQKHVLKLIGDNKTVGEVAAELGITESGVYGHIRRIKAAGHEVPAPRRPDENEVITSGRAEENGNKVAGADFEPEMAYAVLEEAGVKALEAEKVLLTRARQELESLEQRRSSLENEVKVRQDRIATLERVNTELANRDVEPAVS